MVHPDLTTVGQRFKGSRVEGGPRILKSSKEKYMYKNSHLHPSQGDFVGLEDGGVTPPFLNPPNINGPERCRSRMIGKGRCRSIAGENERQVEQVSDFLALPPTSTHFLLLQPTKIKWTLASNEVVL